MKDRLKFRVWSKKYNKFIEDNRYPIGSDYQLIITQSGTLIKLGLGDFEDDCEDSYSWATFKNYEQDCMVMQCTGLKDKNGKLIFEGDLLKHLGEDDERVEIVWNEEKARFGLMIQWTDPCYWNGLYEETKTCRDYYDLDDYYAEDFEVIGNIYENPLDTTKN